MEERVLMTNELWSELEKEAYNSPFFRKRFLIGEDIITVSSGINKNKITYSIYINGVMRGAEEKEKQDKFWFGRVKRFSKKEKVALKKLAKLSEGEEKKEYLEKYKTGRMYTYRIPFFDSFRSIKNQYKKLEEDVFLIEEKLG